MGFGKIATLMAGGLSEISGLIVKIKSLPQEEYAKLQLANFQPSLNKNIERKNLSFNYDASEGGIFYDGKNITELNKNQLRENVSYIDQNVYIFNGSLLFWVDMI